jgi:glycopeptide antibiotics resistance protein
MIALIGLIVTLVNIFSNTVSLTPFWSGFQFYGNINLVPFISIVKMVKDILSADPSRYSFVNFFGNIGFFIPLGFFLPLVNRKLDAGWKVILFGCLVSILIEVWQLFIPARGTDIDDVILNTLGTAIGYFCFWLFIKIFPKIYHHLYK